METTALSVTVPVTMWAKFYCKPESAGFTMSINLKYLSAVALLALKVQSLFIVFINMQRSSPTNAK